MYLKFNNFCVCDTDYVTPVFKQWLNYTLHILNISFN